MVIILLADILAKCLRFTKYQFISNYVKQHNISCGALNV